MKNVRALRIIRKIIVVLFIGLVLFPGLILLLIYGPSYCVNSHMTHEYRETAFQYVKENYGDNYEIVNEVIFYEPPFGKIISYITYTISDKNGTDFDFDIEVKDSKVTQDEYYFVNNFEPHEKAKEYVKNKYGDHYEIMAHSMIINYTSNGYSKSIYYYFYDLNKNDFRFKVEWESTANDIVSDTFNSDTIDG